MKVRWLIIFTVIAGCLVPIAAARDDVGDGKEPAGMLAPDGSRFRWWDWLDDNGPAAVLLWSSWTPHADAVLARYNELRAACQERGLSLIVVDVQEPMVEARAALGDRQLEWVHDRHGAVLKRHRVFRVPMLLILDRHGTALASLEPKPEAVRTWSGPP
jgi:hypothetical protein